MHESHYRISLPSLREFPSSEQAGFGYATGPAEEYLILQIQKRPYCITSPFESYPNVLCKEVHIEEFREVGIIVPAQGNRDLHNSRPPELEEDAVEQCQYWLADWGDLLLIVIGLQKRSFDEVGAAYIRAQRIFGRTRYDLFLPHDQEKPLCIEWEMIKPRVERTERVERAK